MVSCTYNCLMSVINIGNSIIGVSILAMPYCFRKCGILLSFVLIIVSGLLTKLACYLLLKSAVMARRRSFEFLAFHIFGSYGKLAVEMCVIGFLIGVCIAFFVVIGDLGPPLAVEFLNIENAANLRTNVLILVGLCVALPLGLLRKIDSLTSLSALSIAFYVCLILKIFAEAVPNLAENEWWYTVNWWRSEGILPCLPIFSMALSCQTQLFEFFDTQNDPSVKRMQSVIDGAVFLCSAVYLMVGIFGYIAFYDKNITGNVLVLLTPSVITEFIKLGFLLTVAVSFPLCLFPCRSSLHSLLFKQGFGHHDVNVNIIPDHRFRILTVSLVIVTIGIAIMLPNIEFVLGIIGSTIGTLICLILPALIFISDSNKMSSERRKAQILFGIGTFILIACTISTLQENSKRPEPVPIEISSIQKVSPPPLLILSSPIPEIIQSPNIVLKEEPVIQNEKKIEIPDTKILDDQKRLEPPIPQEPEIKVQDNSDLDPQAFQKEDKELQKDVNHPSSNSAGISKKEDGLDKQEVLLKKLEEQHEEQKLLIEEHKKLLKELKLHQESHEIKRNEQNEKQEVGKMNHAQTSPPIKESSIKIAEIPVVEVKEQAKIIPPAEKVSVVSESVRHEPLIYMKPLEKITDPVKNSSSDIITKQKVPQKLDSNVHKDKLVNVPGSILPVKKPVIINKFNETSVNLKNEGQNKKLNLSSVFIPKKENILNIPSLKKDPVNIPSMNKETTNVPLSVKKTSENIPLSVKKTNVNIPIVKTDTVNTPDTKNSELHVKHRETLEKKFDSEIAVSVQKQDSGNILNAKKIT